LEEDACYNLHLPPTDTQKKKFRSNYFFAAWRISFGSTTHCSYANHKQCLPRKLLASCKAAFLSASRRCEEGCTSYYVLKLPPMGQKDISGGKQSPAYFNPTRHPSDKSGLLDVMLPAFHAQCLCFLCTNAYPAASSSSQSRLSYPYSESGRKSSNTDPEETTSTARLQKIMTGTSRTQPSTLPQLHLGGLVAVDMPVQSLVAGGPQLMKSPPHPVTLYPHHERMTLFEG
jgi:hypothetical protein